ncbi:tRNA(Ile)-lysidine synthase [Candidatus Blochmanniella vafra str. BVAF]|uniref:tRNA(Ile)-lysidine synthase n=1 Tax=Blochmanniella vafra (strain BVAF) TaxID=859654 RepID=E8Q6U2_BLOVB|nr:tRNA lysidine(34) synthetase TilS [Candidatus Blochmannia vafer]ADV33689.1 tRNA(Ile)-lysidine synthase [Candidatus Blochmannia vafer str. BVAF]
MLIDIDTLILSTNLSLQDKYLYNQVACCILNYRNLLLSYSGGLDSTVLLDILTTLTKNSQIWMKSRKFPLFLKAVYVHHGLNEKADDWANHCAHQCQIRDVPFNILYIQYFNFCKKRSNVESLARKLRYQVLYDYLNVNVEEILLTAHHMDDQLETVLLALKRGSGPAGLSGISREVWLNYDYRYRVLRPLLGCSRGQLEEYAHRRKLIWINDDTNVNIRFDRNFLRIQVIPLLNKRWPAFNKVVTRTAQLCRNQENLLRELLLETLNTLVDVNGALFFLPLLKYSHSKRQALLRFWLRNFFKDMPSYRLLQCIWTEVALSKVDSKPVLNLGKNHICCRFRKKLYILPITMKSPLNTFNLSWNPFNKIMMLPDKLGLLISRSCMINECFCHKTKQFYNNKNILLPDFLLNYSTNNGRVVTNCFIRNPKVDEKIFIRFGNVSGLLYLMNRNRGRLLKKIWQEYSIPPWLRSRIPLLFYNEILISAIGVFITKDGSITRLTDEKIINDDIIAVRQISWVQNDLIYNLFKGVICNVLK